MFFLKANRLAIMISVLVFSSLIFLRNFGVFTAPTFSFNLQKIEKTSSTLEDLPLNLISSYYNTLLEVEPITKGIAIISQYGIPVYLFFLFYFLIKNREKEEKIERGGEKVEGKELRKIILNSLKDKNENYRLEIAKQKIPVPYNEENRKFLVLAKAGAGKTQAIFSLLFSKFEGQKGIKDLKETMIIYERKGTDFVPKLYRRKSGKDFLFDPRDKMGIKWNIFKDLLKEDNEIDEALIDFYVSSMIPVSTGNSAHFDKQAQSVFKAILLKISGEEEPSNKKLIDFLQAKGNLVDLRKSLVEDKTVQKFGLDNNVINSLTTDREGNPDGQGSSVIATLNDVFKKISRREFYFDEGDFSVKEFINSIDTNKDKRLFIVNTTETAGSFNLYFSLFFNLIFRAGLSLENNSKRRVWLIWDEIQSIGSNGNNALGEYVISEFINFLAESRSKGFAEIVATQSLPQLEKLIKKEGVRSLFQLLSTKILGQYDEPEGQKFICSFLGEQEIKREKHSNSEGVKINDGRTNISEEEKIKKIILESELSSLPPLNFFLKLGSFPVSKIEIDYNDPRDITQTLIKREIPFFNREDILNLKNAKDKEDEEIEELKKEIEEIEEIEDKKMEEIEEIEDKKMEENNDEMGFLDHLEMPEIPDFELNAEMELNDDELNAEMENEEIFENADEIEVKEDKEEITEEENEGKFI
ncbi:type IV secretory system conjugative DNA transfer family protein [Aliarcobacter skirrowii]|uniref:type IV secretory system conjugative DNA transfer family protein n=1 Tax=Aliarcobacter skirrowii TaxID=28200 RepID=UPI000832F87B|nr:type IV secretion system DNA-binding domain-containing protein [Aliarcobacter skirrowii]